MRNKRISLADICIMIGLLLVCSGGLLVVHNMKEARDAMIASQSVQQRILEIISEKKNSYEYISDPENKEMETEEIDGYRYLGVIEIPALNISLPVMDECDYIRLRIAPCHWYGSYYTDDFIICAHNYETHFNPIRSINIDTDVYFTNVEGVTIHYVVSNIETIMPDEVDKMRNNSKNSDSQNDWDLTLFTCNFSGVNRCAVRCIRVAD